MLKTLSFSELSVAIYKNQRSPVDKSLILFEKRWDSTDFSFVIEKKLCSALPFMLKDLRISSDPSLEDNLHV